MIREKYLPIGTIVILKNGEKKMMITGFNPSTEDENGTISFDYSGCVYPEGIISSDESYLFNHDMIDNVCFIGYEDEDERVFAEILKGDIKNIGKSVLDDKMTNQVTNVTEEKSELTIPKNKSNVFEKLRV